ncbi:MAG TPA: methyltransferase domain-containing protein [Bryobacteraceae bacterium]|nr:methyltransferase domain-containing protein [Bryobacteraceae bacterium]
MSEFTGERAIPGEIDADLLNEHVARYLFAARLARGKRVLDAGCGAGYGSAELARAAQSVVGADVAAEAVGHARAHYQAANLCFECASCAALPHPDSAFDLVVAFEVIEHLADWRQFLLEARRVLAPTGQFIVSTPNKLYYDESRGAAGANPFHAHEFEFDELREELTRIFPHVSLFLQNHVDALAFQPDAPDSAVEVRVDNAGPKPAEANFFVAVCAHRTQLGAPTFVYVPETANVLRERERHIAKLEAEVEAKNSWLAEAEQSHAALLEAHRALTEELHSSNRWAESANRELEERRARVAALQEEVEKANRWALGEGARLEAELRKSNEWARGLDAEIERLRTEIKNLLDRVAPLEEQLARSEDRRGQMDEQMQMIRSSRWVKLGRKFGVGPSF